MKTSNVAEVNNNQLKLKVYQMRQKICSHLKNQHLQMLSSMIPNKPRITDSRMNFASHESNEGYHKIS